MFKFRSSLHQELNYCKFHCHKFWIIVSKDYTLVRNCDLDHHWLVHLDPSSGILAVPLILDLMPAFPVPTAGHWNQKSNTTAENQKLQIVAQLNRILAQRMQVWALGCSKHLAQSLGIHYIRFCAFFQSGLNLRFNYFNLLIHCSLTSDMLTYRIFTRLLEWIVNVYYLRFDLFNVTIIVQCDALSIM